MQWVEDTGVKAFVEEKPEDVAAVMTGRLKSYLYIAQIRRCRLQPLEKQIEAVPIIADGEDLRQNFTLRVDDVAVVLVFGNINAHVNHGNPSLVVFDAAGVHRTSCSRNLVLHKPSGGI